MKNLSAIVFLCSLLLGASLQARAPHERTLDEAIFDMNQHGKIKATQLNQLDMEIFQAQENFNRETESLPEPTTMTEGKIQATMINMIGHQLIEVQEMRAQLEAKNEILDRDLEPIKAKLDEVQRLVEELVFQ